MKTLLWSLILLILAPAVIAQNACPAIVEQALQRLDQICAATGRNEACYGNVALQAESQPEVNDFRFSQIGDIENVADLRSLKLEPMNETNGTWGVVLMNLQANLPDTLPGQNVTFLLFGDVEITSAAGSEQNPMQAFYLKTGIGDAPCAEAPDSGLLVQTPSGVGEVTFNINGVDVAMGSTVLFRTKSDSEMRVVTLEGSAALRVRNQMVPVIKGTAAEVPAIMEEPMMEMAEASESPADDVMAAAPAPDMFIEPEPFDEEEIEGLPFGVLSRELEDVEPLSDEDYQQILERIENNEPLCGFGSLPSCESVISELGGDLCNLSEDEECDITTLYLQQGCIGEWDDTTELPEELADLPLCEDLYNDDLEDDIEDFGDEDSESFSDDEDSGSGADFTDDESGDDSGTDDNGDDGNDDSGNDDSGDDGNDDSGDGDGGSDDDGGDD